MYFLSLGIKGLGLGLVSSQPLMRTQPEGGTRRCDHTTAARGPLSAKFFILCGVVFLVRLQGKFIIYHLWEWNGKHKSQLFPPSERKMWWYDKMLDKPNALVTIRSLSTLEKLGEKFSSCKQTTSDFCLPPPLAVLCLCVLHCFIWYFYCTCLSSSFQIILHSMHKYQPRIHILKKKDTTDATLDVDRPSSLKKTFTFPETVFTTVTAYQNQQVGRQAN